MLEIDCPQCGLEFDAEVHFDADTATVCPRCGLEGHADVGDGADLLNWEAFTRPDPIPEDWVELMEPTPSRATVRLVSIVPEDDQFRVTFSVDTGEADATVAPLTMLVGISDGGISMSPDDHVGDCLELMASCDMSEVLSPRLRAMYLTGRAADELMGTLAASGLLSPTEVSLN